jgi:hypothetical protein
MKNFKTYISELYTIGHTRFYDANANRMAFNRKHGHPEKLSTIPHKLGRQDGDHGGAAYRTTADATKGAHTLKKEFPGRKYSVYKLKGDFDKDTYHSKETGMNHLKRNTEITGKVAHNVTEEKDPRLARAGVKGFNKAKGTPSHPTKSHIVVAKDGNKIKTIRFGEQGASTAGDPKKGESDRMKAKRKSFKARHGKNIAKGKMSAAYWADKVKW